MKQAPKDLRFLILIIIVLMVAAYFVSSNVRHESQIKKLRGAEWIDYDQEGRLYFTYKEDVYRLNPDNAFPEKIIDTDLKISSSDIMDIAIAPSGRIFLTDPKAGEVRAYSNDGALQYRLKGQFKENARIAADDERLYIADMQGNRVMALDSKDGNILWTNRGYMIPDSIFIRNRVVYVSDETKNLVRKLNAKKGEVLKDLRLDFSGYTYGSSMLVLNDGSILLAPSYTRNGSLKKFSEDGEFIREIEGPEGFMPVDMAVNRDGTVMITDDEDYSFYLFGNDVIELVRSKNTDALFSVEKNKRISLMKIAFYDKLIAMACVIVLLGLYIAYRRSKQRTV